MNDRFDAVAFDPPVFDQCRRKCLVRLQQCQCAFSERLSVEADTVSRRRSPSPRSQSRLSIISRFEIRVRNPFLDVGRGSFATQLSHGKFWAWSAMSPIATASS